MAVSRRLRFEILRRDSHTCRYCGAKAPDVILHVDHVTPVSLGGADTPDNLVAACKDCNIGKSSVPADAAMAADVAAKAFVFAQVLAEVAEYRRAERIAAERVRTGVQDKWNSYSYRVGEARYKVDHSTDWTSTINRFYELGLDEADMVDFVEVAMSAQVRDRDDELARWRYFCGCCWKEIKVRQDATNHILGEEARP